MIGANVSSFTYSPNPVYINLYVPAGTDWQANIQMNGDLTNCVAYAEAKDFYTPANIIFKFTTSINVSSNTLTLSLTANTTDYYSSNIQPGRYEYDVLVINQTTNAFSRPIEGQVILSRQVSMMADY